MRGLLVVLLFCVALFLQGCDDEAGSQSLWSDLKSVPDKSMEHFRLGIYFIVHRRHSRFSTCFATWPGGGSLGGASRAEGLSCSSELGANSKDCDESKRTVSIPVDTRVPVMWHVLKDASSTGKLLVTTPHMSAGCAQGRKLGWFEGRRPCSQTAYPQVHASYCQICCACPGRGEAGAMDRVHASASTTWVASDPLQQTLGLFPFRDFRAHWRSIKAWNGACKQCHLGANRGANLARGACPALGAWHRPN